MAAAGRRRGLRVCVQMISYSLLCKYFRRAVLPADKALYADIYRQRTRTCERCGKPFAHLVATGRNTARNVAAPSDASRRRTLPDGGAASNIKRRESLDFRGFFEGKACASLLFDLGIPKFLEDHGLRQMRFHDLRHSCASLLLANSVPLKHIQEWLGHSDFTTTANIYAHLDYKSKITSAQAMETGLALPEGGDFGSCWREG